jgi:hypothetical protein
MAFTVEHNIFITMAYFRSGFINVNVYLEYSRRSVYHRFLLFCPEEVKYRIF